MPVVMNLLDFGLTGFGPGRVILRNPVTGVLCGGTEPRTDPAIAMP